MNRNGEPCSAIFVVGADTEYAIVMFATGDFAEEVSDVSSHVGDLDIAYPKAPGFYRWDGVIEVHGPGYYDQDVDVYYRGTIRPLTALEVFAIARGRAPWDVAPTSSVEYSAHVEARRERLIEIDPVDARDTHAADPSVDPRFAFVWLPRTILRDLHEHGKRARK